MTHSHGLGAVEEQPFYDSGPRSGPPDALILDIGGDVGALIVYADEARLGAEIDLTPLGAPRSHHMHTMVRRRRATGKDVIAGLYPELAEGTYTLWGLQGTGPIGEVTILGGQVSEFHAGDCLGSRLGPDDDTGHAGHGDTNGGAQHSTKLPHTHP